MPIRKYMVFRLAEQKYCVPLNQVREVIGLPKVTEVPGLQGYHLGLINLRGQIIGILDLSRKLKVQEQRSLKDSAKGKMTVMIIEGPFGQIGCRVDDVLEVSSIDDESIEKATDQSDSQISAVVRARSGEVYLLIEAKRFLSDVYPPVVQAQDAVRQPLVNNG